MEGALSGGDVWAVLKPQRLPAVFVGCIVCVLLIALTKSAPVEIAKLSQAFDIPWAAKLLYDGVTEEVMLKTMRS